MAEIIIRLQSDVEDFAEPLRKFLQQVTDETESFCGYILGCPDMLEEHYKRATFANAQFVAVLTDIRNGLSEIQNDDEISRVFLEKF